MRHLAKAGAKDLKRSRLNLDFPETDKMELNLNCSEKNMNSHFDKINDGAVLETQEQLFTERNLLMGILWEGDSQLHTNGPGMAKTPYGTTIVHGNSVTSMVIGQLLRFHVGAAEKIRISEINIVYLAAIHVGDRIKGVFTIEERNKYSNGSEILTMTFEVIRNEQTIVSKGKMTIEIK